jgi:hypothetical protein
MKKTIIALLLLSALGFSANRTITGSTGYLVMPTAEGIRAREYNLGLNAFSGTKFVKAHWKYYAGIGTEGAEYTISGRSEREGLFLNTKWFGALNNYEDPLYVGIGFENLSSLGNYGDYANLFMVVTKKFWNNTSFSIGSTGRYINKEVRASMLFGFEFFTSETISWLMDWSAYEDNKYNGNVGLRVYTSNNMCFSVTALNAIRSTTAEGLNEPVVTIGVTMTGFM